uniref:Uncharacterized protein n=1 Tax=Cacopsylla melanoneura TaxID=428564 RepID=A0A8D8ZAY5_9HEMI
MNFSQISKLCHHCKSMEFGVLELLGIRNWAQKYENQSVFQHTNKNPFSRHYFEWLEFFETPCRYNFKVHNKNKNFCSSLESAEVEICKISKNNIFGVPRNGMIKIVFDDKLNVYPF